LSEPDHVCLPPKHARSPARDRRHRARARTNETLAHDVTKKDCGSLCRIVKGRPATDEAWSISAP
jgi:hypothetical protein